MYAKMGEVTDRDLYGRRRGQCNVRQIVRRG